MINVSAEYDHAHSVCFAGRRSFKHALLSYRIIIEIIEATGRIFTINDEISLLWIWHTPHEAGKDAC